MSTFTKKVGCAALSCRKVFLLAAVAAMAFGAQAGEGTTEGGTTAGTKLYSFTFELQNIAAQTDGRPDHDFIYLADSAGKVICYVDRGTLDETRKGDMVKDGDNWALRDSAISHSAASDGSTLFNALSGKEVLAHTLKSATIVKPEAGSSTRIFTVTFESNYDLESKDSAGHIGWYDGKVGYSEGLDIVVTNSKESGTCLEYMTQHNPGVSHTMEGGSGWALTGGAAYAVPEPTSAMLLLLGVAGLALKRKVA